MNYSVFKMLRQLLQDTCVDPETVKQRCVIVDGRRPHFSYIAIHIHIGIGIGIQHGGVRTEKIQQGRIVIDGRRPHL